MSAPFLSGGPLDVIYVPFLLVRYESGKIEYIPCTRAFARKADARKWIRGGQVVAGRKGGVEAWSDIITIRKEMFDGSDEGT